MKFQMVGLVLHCVNPLLILESWKCQTVVYSLCIHYISQAAVSFELFDEGFATCNPLSISLLERFQCPLLFAILP